MRVAALRTTLLAVGVALGMMVSAGPSVALGNGYAYRSCGSNFIWSWNDGTAKGHALTQKQSGSCTDTLSVAWVNGQSSGPRTSGSTTYVRVNPGFAITGGLHWGCPSCNASVT